MTVGSYTPPGAPEGVYAVDTTVTVNCADDYKPVGSATVRCLSGGRWQPFTCAPVNSSNPITPADVVSNRGEKSPHPGSVCVFPCYRGRLSGCFNVPQVANAIALPGLSEKRQNLYWPLKTVAKLQCDEGYSSPVSPPSVTCLTGGYWSSAVCLRTSDVPEIPPQPSRNSTQFQMCRV